MLTAFHQVFRSGLTVGQRVVLADLSEPLPTDSTVDGPRRFGGPGGFGSGGFRSTVRVGPGG